MAHAPGDSQGQHEPSLSKSIATKQELIVPVLSPEIPQQTTSEPIKSTEPILLDERALLGCLVRAVPEEASNKIRISSTVSICFILQEFSTCLLPLCFSLQNFLQICWLLNNMQQQGSMKIDVVLCRHCMLCNSLLELI